MSYRLPPLNGLRAFEASARHLSFRRAADELCVTPGAVSQQVKSLEASIGVKLFRRLPRGLLLTAAGEDYLPSISRAFHPISDATDLPLKFHPTVVRVSGPLRADCAVSAVCQTLPACPDYRTSVAEEKREPVSLPVEPFDTFPFDEGECQRRSFIEEQTSFARPHENSSLDPAIRDELC